MNKIAFSEADLEQIREHDLEPEAVLRHIEMFERGLPPTRLVRACGVGDGIKRLERKHLKRLSDEYAGCIADRVVVKFVPASGAASRMFRSITRFLESPAKTGEPSVKDLITSGDPEKSSLAEVIKNIERFAFFPDLAEKLRAKGLTPKVEIESGHWRKILSVLMDAEGLDYARLPKGMIKFHAYPDGTRTAFEEHILEALATTRGREGRARLHFTVDPKHESLIRKHIQERRGLYETPDRPCEISFSNQSPSTDTIAVDLDNRPLRDTHGRLVFRPGGHGALLGNLARLGADLVFVKNVDNVVPDDRKPVTYLYRTALAALLLKLQGRTHDFLDRLAARPENKELVKRVERFAREELGLPRLEKDADQSAGAWFERLNRPMRICAMVRNQGEPGGGPFWVDDRKGRLSLQIVEEPQVNRNDEEQWKIYSSSTFFNPTDIACAVRDFQGRPFDLPRYVDPEAAFITRKSMGGSELKALEKPGLWNGSMAGWISIFVEAPLVMFNPVKTVNALLRPEHQPRACSEGEEEGE